MADVIDIDEKRRLKEQKEAERRKKEEEKVRKQEEREQAKRQKQEAQKAKEEAVALARETSQTERQLFYELAKLNDDLGRLPENEKFSIHLDAPLNDQVSVALLALQTHSRLFQMDGALVEIRHGLERVKIARPEPVRILEITSGFCRGFQRTKEGIDKPASLTQLLGNALACHGSYGDLRKLRGLTTAPMWRAGQTVVSPGWDSGTEVYLAEGLPRIPPVSDNPTPAEVEKACRWLRAPFAEFEAVDKEMLYSVCASAILTGVARWDYNGPSGPLHAISATSAGCGKGLVCDAITTIDFGRVYKDSLKTDEQQLAHLFVTLAKEGAECIAFDNLDAKSGTGSGVLNKQLTADRVRERLMRQNDTADLPFRPLWLATGNALVPSVDGARRWVLAKLTASTDRPQDREFRRKDLLAFVRKARPQILWAALTILKAYDRAGRPWPMVRVGPNLSADDGGSNGSDSPTSSPNGAPKGSTESTPVTSSGILDATQNGSADTQSGQASEEGKRVPAKLLGSFEGWSRSVRFPLMWAGFVDPVRSQEGLADEGMVATDQLIEGIELLCSHLKRERPEVTTTELHEAGTLGMEDKTKKSVLGGKLPRVVNGPLRELVQDQKLTTFSKRVKELNGRVSGGKRIVNVNRSGTSVWRVEGVK